MLAEGVGARFVSPPVPNDAGSNPARGELAFISWWFHGIELYILILARVGLFVCQEQLSVCQIWQEEVLKKKKKDML